MKLLSGLAELEESIACANKNDEDAAYLDYCRMFQGNQTFSLVYVDKKVGYKFVKK